MSVRERRGVEEENVADQEEDMLLRKRRNVTEVEEDILLRKRRICN